jgi:hypothetical protein
VTTRAAAAARYAVALLVATAGGLPECSAQAPTLAQAPPLPPSFGRLFHTPAQRLELDRERDRPSPPPPAAVAAPAAPPQPALLIDGILRRSDGYQLVWLNGEALDLPPGLRLAPGPTLMLIPEAAPRLRLHVGDRWQAVVPAAAAR